MKLKDSNPEVLSAQADKKSRKGIGAKLCIGAAIILAASAIVLTLFTGNIDTEKSLAASVADNGESTAQIDMYLAQAQTQTTTRQTEKTTAKQTTAKVTTKKTTKKTTKATEATEPSTEATTTVVTQAPVTTKAPETSKPKATTTTFKFSEYKMYTNDTLNLRSGAGVGYKKLAEIPLATEITVTGEETNGWYPVKYGDKSGYVSGKYIQKDKPKVTKIVTTTTTKTTTAAKTTAKSQPAKTTTSKIKTELLGTFKITAYCACEKCCGNGASGYTANGTVATQGKTIAASSKYPFGTKLMINSTVYTVEDRGGSVSENVIDMFFSNHQDACNWGIQYCEVYKVV